MNGATPGPADGPADGPTGVLVAAGRGRRLGAPKATIPWPTEAGERPLAGAVAAMLRTVCPLVLIVTGPEAGELRRAGLASGVRLIGGDPNGEMLGSIRRGLLAAGEHRPGRAMLVHLVDVPLVRPATIRAILEEAARRPDRAVMPEVGGRGGHPVLVPAGLAGAIIAWRGEGGLRRFWLEHPGRRVRLPLEDPWAVADVDDPADLAAARAEAEARLSGPRDPSTPDRRA